MPATNRRAFLAAVGVAFLGGSGCTVPNSSRPAHWVSVYLGEREETHDVTVTVTDESGTSLFERSYRLSDENGTDEDATFPASSDPERLVVTVDGARFERDWTGFEQPQLPCDDPNRAGVENDEDGTPGIRMEADCQRVTTA